MRHAALKTERVLLAWEEELRAMHPEGRELVTLAVRETVKACHAIRPYQVKELCRAFDLPLPTLGSRFTRSGIVGGPGQIIRAVRVLVGVLRIEELARDQYRHTIRLRQVAYDMGIAHTHAFTTFIRRCNPPTFAELGERPWGWLKYSTFEPVARGYAARLFPAELWREFHPLRDTPSPPPALAVCESCARPMYTP